MKSDVSAHNWSSITRVISVEGLMDNTLDNGRLDVRSGPCLRGSQNLRGIENLRGSLLGYVQAGFMDRLLNNNLRGWRAVNYRHLDGGFSYNSFGLNGLILGSLLDSFLGDIVSYHSVSGLVDIGNNWLHHSIKPDDGLSERLGLHDLLNSSGGGVLGHSVVRDVGYIFSLVFNLLIISVWHLYGLIICMLNSLIIC